MMKRKITLLGTALAAGLIAACDGDNSSNNTVVMTPPTPDASMQFVAEVATEVGTTSNRAPDDISAIVVGTSETDAPADISSITVGS
jgi:ABC-type amino acid transport substrate-binding protein